MDDNITACSNCTCPINYDCIRFNNFYDGKYIYSEEFRHNNDFSCDNKMEEENNKNLNDRSYSLFKDQL